MGHRDQAVVHGLIWKNDGLSHPPRLLKKFRDKIQFLQAQIQHKPTPQAWIEVHQLYADIQRIGASLYGSNLPSELRIPETLATQIKDHNHSISPRWIDELWG